MLAICFGIALRTHNNNNNLSRFSLYFVFISPIAISSLQLQPLNRSIQLLWCSFIGTKEKIESIKMLTLKCVSTKSLIALLNPFFFYHKKNVELSHRHPDSGQLRNKNWSAFRTQIFRSNEQEMIFVHIHGSKCGLPHDWMYVRFDVVVARFAHVPHPQITHVFMRVPVCLCNVQYTNRYAQSAQ